MNKYGKQKIIIVGGNAAGPAAAAKAKRVNPQAEVVMFEAGKFISTGTCEMPYVISGEIDDHSKIVYFDEESFYLKKGVKVHTEHLVESIDRRRKFIVVKNTKNEEYGKFEYDKLILTTGSKAKSVPGLPDSLDNVFNLKQVSDLVKIKAYLNGNQVENVLVVGSGYIGLETAEAFSELGKNVSVLEIADLPLPAAEPEIQHLVNTLLEKKGVRFLGNASSAEFVTIGNRFKNLKYNGRFIDFDLAVVAIGVKPNIDLAVSANLEIGSLGGLKVDSKLKTSDPNIFAAGDNIEVINRITNRPDYFPIATIAHSHGHIAGANAAGDNLFAKPVIKNMAVKIFGNAFASVGLTLREAKEISIYASEVHAVVNNLVKVMPESKKVFGKIVFDKQTRKIYGGSFFGGKETIGYADFISALIFTKTEADVLTEINYNYTPPFSPFINLLSVLGRKIRETKI